MRRFKWIEWNLAKIDSHALSTPEVEASFERVYHLERRDDESSEMFTETPSGRRIWVIWRHDREEDVPDSVTGMEIGDPVIFVITAYQETLTW